MADRARAASGEAKKFFETAAACEGDDCLIWPFSRVHGYARYSLGGRGSSACRLLCALVHGEPPTPDHEAAHECGNGHLGCVNPRHLVWKTNPQNVEDKYRHGRIARGERVSTNKLSEDDVRLIRELLPYMTQSGSGSV